MNIAELHKLKAATEHASALQRDWEKHKRKLLALPGKLGFNSVSELQIALNLVTPKDGHHRTAEVKLLRKKRITITKALEARTRALVLEGKSNGEIAVALELSPASVQNIKSRLGLTKKRR
jgi:DNA-binding NarL/FixJ family response regulator